MFDRVDPGSGPVTTMARPSSPEPEFLVALNNSNGLFMRYDSGNIVNYFDVKERRLFWG